MKYNLSLVELLVIVVFIAILSLVSIPVKPKEPVHSREQTTVVTPVQSEMVDNTETADRKI